MFRTITILLFVIAAVAFLWPTLMEGAELARKKFKKTYAPSAQPESPTSEKQPEDKQ